MQSLVWAQNSPTDDGMIQTFYSFNNKDPPLLTEIKWHFML